MNSVKIGDCSPESFTYHLDLSDITSRFKLHFLGWLHDSRGKKPSQNDLEPEVDVARSDEFIWKAAWSSSKDTVKILSCLWGKLERFRDSGNPMRTPIKNGKT